MENALACGGRACGTRMQALAWGAYNSYGEYLPLAEIEARRSGQGDWFAILVTVLHVGTTVSPPEGG